MYCYCYFFIFLNEESDIHPISLNTSDPQYQPIERKKRKGKIVEDYIVGIEQLRPMKKH